MSLRKYFDQHADKMFFVFRVLVGLLFFLHGWQKVAGFTDGKIQLLSLFGLAMVIEVVAGVLIILGLLTRWTALVGAVEMLVAYFYAHLPNGWHPLVNKGEPALLFFAAFLVLLGYGAGKWAIDNKLNKVKSTKAR